MSSPSFPFVYECAECGLEMTVTRSEAQELNPHPDMFAAMAVLLRRRGWTRSPEKNALYCPECTAQGEEMTNRSYPFVFECSNCGAETKVTRSIARDLHSDPDDRWALDTVLQYRGWMKAPIDRALYCPDCIDRAKEDTA